MAAQDIIIRPIITEKSMAGIADKKYTFEVAKDATKIDIARAVEELFGVKVAQGEHPACARPPAPPGPLRGLHPFLEEGRRHPDRGQQDHRVL